MRVRDREANMQHAAQRYSAYQRLQFAYPAPRVAVIITGTGRYFSAGGDFSLVRAQIDSFEARVSG